MPKLRDNGEMKPKGVELAMSGVIPNPSGVVPEDPKTPGDKVRGRPPTKLDKPPIFLPCAVVERSVRLVSSLISELSSSSSFSFFLVVSAGVTVVAGMEDPATFFPFCCCDCGKGVAVGLLDAVEEVLLAVWSELIEADEGS